MASRKKIGLALGSGASRGWAHIGAIEALEEAGVAVDLTSRLFPRKRKVKEKKHGIPHELKRELLKKLAAYYDHAESGFKAKIGEMLKGESEAPDIVETVLASVNIVQQRIAGINLAVDPPDVLIQPRLGEMKMLEFDRVEQAIEEGYIAVKEKIEDIRMRMENP